jgi:arsenate reductase
MTTCTIYHNPKCSKSRQTLGLLTENNVNTNIIEYLKTPLINSQIKTLLTQLNFSSPRDLMRQKDDLYKELNLANTELSDEQLIQAMANNPKLIERPIVVINNKAVLGRPPENIFTLLR